METITIKKEENALHTEVVYINIPGPGLPYPGMSGGELLHGFLAELYSTTNPKIKNYISTLCIKWNIHYRVPKNPSFEDRPYEKPQKTDLIARMNKLRKDIGPIGIKTSRLVHLGRRK